MLTVIARAFVSQPAAVIQTICDSSMVTCAETHHACTLPPGGVLYIVKLMLHLITITLQQRFSSQSVSWDCAHDSITVPQPNWHADCGL